MYRSRLPIVLAFVLLAVKQSHAIEDIDGHFLLDMIEASRNEAGMELAFVAYVAGFASGQRMAWKDYQVEPRYCIPDGASHGDVAKVVRRFVEHGAVYGFSSATPQEFLNLGAMAIVHLGLSMHYQCGD